MIEIMINGQPTRFSKSLGLIPLLNELGVRGEFVAIALNGEVLDKDEYVNTTIQNGDNIEIVQPVGGGSP